MNKQFRLTNEGIGGLKAELTKLTEKRGHVAEAIRTAREQGDLGENAEYQTARSEQERVEARITEIEHILLNTSVIAKPKSGGKVQLGSNVKLKSSGGKSKEFRVVGTVEADPLNGKISDESPIGRALMGNKVGDKVVISAAEYKIASIS
ncbi:MAG: transcription elongation factor GreA [Patescibacteria group bacterium]